VKGTDVIKGDVYDELVTTYETIVGKNMPDGEIDLVAIFKQMRKSFEYIL